MKKMIKFYQVLTNILVQKLTQKELSLNILQQVFTKNHKDSPTYSSENFTTLKYLGTTLVNLNYNIFMMTLEAENIQRMHLIIHSSIYLHNSYIRTYLLFYFVCHTKGGKNYWVCWKKKENREQVDTGNRKPYWGISHVYFQQDGATAHAPMNILRNMFHGRLISRYGDVPWPPRSPDLSSCDFFL
jgi:hypothetical protein